MLPIRRSWGTSLSVCAFVLALTASSSGRAFSATTTVSIVSVFGPQFFSPEPATAVTGDSLVWRNADSFTHRIVLDRDASFDTGNLFPGDSSAPLALPAGGGTYHCLIHPNMVGTIVVTGTGGVAPAITTQPASQSVTAGNPAQFTVAASGTPAPTYRWQRSTDAGSTFADVTDGSPYSGATTTTLTVSPTATSQSGSQYRAVATNATGSATSNAATLTVAAVPAPVITVATSPTSLAFSATNLNGTLTNVSAAQSVTVSFSGGSAAWTAATTSPWLRLTTASGTGTGQFSVAVVSAAGLPASGTVTGAVTVTSAAAANSPVQVAVTLTLLAGTSPPFGQMDTPDQNTTGVVGAISVTGWALDDVGVTSVKLYRTCLSFDAPASCQVVGGNILVFIGDAVFLAGARPDVEAAFSSFPQANRAGWGYLLLTTMLPHVTNTLGYGGQGPLTLYSYATDVEGNLTLLGRSQTDHTPTSIVMANDTIAKPFGSIDTPGQGETVSGILANFGWVLTPDSNATAGSGDILIPTNGSTMAVFIDGVATATVAYNQCRGTVGNPVPATAFCDDDVANIFGNASPQAPFTPRAANLTKYRNLDAGRAAIGAYNINTAALGNGRHTLAWSVTDSAGRNEGIGSRFFDVVNAGADKLQTSNVKLQTGQRADDVWRRVGFDLTTAFTPLPADRYGTRQVQIPALGRLELWLGPTDTAYLVANGTRRDLPPGSHLDAATGQFTWAPAPGYLGTHHLVFVQGPERVLVDVTIGGPIR